MKVSDKMTVGAFRAHRRFHALHSRVAKKLKMSKSETVRKGVELLAVTNNIT